MEETWTVRYHEPTQRIFIVAVGYATQEKSEEAGKRFVELMGSRTVDVVVDLGKMTGYTTGARQAWQTAMYSVRGQMRRMLVIGESVPGLVRMGATVVAAFIGVPIRFFPTLNDLNRAERSE